MTHPKTTLLALLLFGIALPSFAGGFAIDLPDLWFPEPAQPVVSQACGNPTDISDNKCVAK